MKKYYKKAVWSREENFEAEGCAYNKHANWVSLVKWKSKGDAEWQINIVQILVPSSPLKNSEFKKFNELKNIQQLLISTVIIIKKLQKLLKALEKIKKHSMRNATMFKYFHLENDTLYRGAQRVIKLSNKVLS